MRWNAVKKNNFHRVFLTSFCGECGESRWIIFFHRVLSILTKKKSSLHGFEPLTSCMPSNAYSTAPTVTYLFVISCEFKSDWVNFGNHMRWIFVRNAVKCGELFFSPHLAVRKNNSPLERKRWIIFFFTAFTAFTAFLTLICHNSLCGEFL